MCVCVCTCVGGGGGGGNMLRIHAYANTTIKEVHQGYRYTMISVRAVLTYVLTSMPLNTNAHN